MIDLVTFHQAKLHLRNTLVDDNNDSDIQFKVTQASAIVMDYLKLATVPTAWENASSPVTYAIPANVQAATLLVLSELFNNREASVADVLSTTVCSLLHRFRDPALA